MGWAGLCSTVGLLLGGPWLRCARVSEGNSAGGASWAGLSIRAWFGGVKVRGLGSLVGQAIDRAADSEGTAVEDMRVDHGRLNVFAAGALSERPDVLVWRAPVR